MNHTCKECGKPATNLTVFGMDLGPLCNACFRAFNERLMESTSKQLGTRRPPTMNRYTVQHEFDNEPTYVVDTETDNEIAVFSASVPHERRLTLAKRLASMMNAERPRLSPTMNGILPFEIENDNGTEKLTGRVEIDTYGIELYFDGYSTAEVVGGAPIWIEVDDNRAPVVRVWSDIENGDYSHKINLDGAKEHA